MENRSHNYLIPLLGTLVFGIGGILVNSYSPPSSSFFYFLEKSLLPLFFMLVFFFFLIHRKENINRNYWYLGYLIWIYLFFSWNSLRPESKYDSKHYSHYEGEWAFVRLESEPIIKNNRIRMVVEVASLLQKSSINQVQGKLQINLPELKEFRDQSHEVGDYFLIPAKFQEVNPPYNPLELDYKNYLKNRRIEFQNYFPDNTFYKIYKNREWGIVKFGHKIRKSLVEKFEEFIPDNLAAIVASTLILGYRAELEQNVLEIFSATGTIHVLSVSGMHVVIVFWLFEKSLFFLRNSPLLIFSKYILLFLSIWFYALIAGLAPSIIRASCMICFVLISKILKRESFILNSICSSALFILIFDPLMLFDLGFQLSYLAVLGIIFCQSIWSNFKTPSFKPLKLLWEYSAMSCGAQLGSGPLAMFYFKQFPLYFLIANLLIVLPASFIMYLGFGLILSPFEFLAKYIGISLSFTILFMIKMLDIIASWPWASLSIRSYKIYEIVLIYLILGTFILWNYKKKQEFGFIIIGLILLLEYMNIMQVRERLKLRGMMFFNSGNQLAIGYADLKNLFIFHDLDSIDEPYLQNSKIKFHVLPFMKDWAQGRSLLFHNLDELKIQKEVINYQGQIIVPDLRIKTFNADQGLVNQNIHVLMIRNNKKEELAQFLLNNNVELVIVDGSNSFKTLNSVKDLCEGLEQPYYLLKGNNAYFWKLEERKLWKQE